MQGERRHVTLLFSDVSGYTKMMEKNDPEDIQALMSSITQKSIHIIEAYNGYVERILGDEIFAVFGLPVAHEDDAIRAVKAARDIHDAVISMKPASIELADPIAMHTGINTGLTVTARTTPSKDGFDLSGDAVNLASRLADLARPGEILVGPETHRQAFGFFDFDATPPIKIKGKSRPVSIYIVKGEKQRPLTGQRKVNFSASLIGRKKELSQLYEAIRKLEEGQGAIISIVGEAGTGKSRLLLEFERSLSGRPINWITGYAFAHTQQVPYFPLVGIIRRWLDLDGTATEEEMRQGISQKVGTLLGHNAPEIPIVQGLIGQEVQETEGMSPEEWRSRLKTTMLNLLSAVAEQRPTVFCMEDIHWGDSSSFKLLKDIIYNFEKPAIVIYTGRPYASLFTSHELEILSSIYTEIRLGDLSPSETEDMMESMLDTKSLPTDLRKLVRNRAEGNPFYLEEILNALVDSRVLDFKECRWQMNRDFKETDIPSSIHGIIASRMDQLQPEDKRILQEAAVIGRAFLYDILKGISVHAETVDAGLFRLERAGLIKPRALYPEMEFMFKHALIQDVSYNSLLRRERQRVHERIGRTIETLYQDRLSEFDETLAIHFQKSIATDKATDYLIRSGTKALRRCALDESDQYFKTAKNMLEQQQLATPRTKKRLLDVVNQWAFVFYYKGMNRKLLELLEHQQLLLGGLDDPVREGLHWAWHGCALWHRHRFQQAYESLSRALLLGKKTGHFELIGYACTWLSWPCTELGRIGEALSYSQQAESLYLDGQVKDAYIYFNGLHGKAYAYWHKGDAEKTRACGKEMIRFGRQHGNVRSMVSGHCGLGWSDLVGGDTDSALNHFRAAIDVSADPWYSQFPKLALCYGAISNGKVEEALPLLDHLIRFSDDNGAEFVGEPARFFKGLVDIQTGRIHEGLTCMEDLLRKWMAARCKLRTLTCGFVMARAYAHLLDASLRAPNGAEEMSRQALMADHAVRWFNACIPLAKEMGARSMEGRSLTGLGHVLAATGEKAEAEQVLARAVDILGENGASRHLEEALCLLESVNSPKE
jgi:class 3 adenylate cyclase/tetratricopeptide (TPR) repeat protein